MTDPLSITTSVVGLTTAALQSVQFLAKTISDIKDVPDVIKSIRADLQAVEPALVNLNKEVQSGGSQIVLSDQIKPALENCNRACTTFHSQLNHWMRHSTEEKTFWMDRWRVGLFGQEKIKSFKGQLNDCKSTLIVTLSTATTITISRQENLMKEMKDMMLKNNETVIEQEIVRADNEMRGIEQSLQQVSLISNRDPSAESQQSKQELLAEIQIQKASHDNFRKMCEEALSKTVYERTGQKIKSVKATNNSTALAGIFNMSGEDLKIKQDISDITADNYSVAIAGVVGNVNFNDLRPGGPGSK